MHNIAVHLLMLAVIQLRNTVFQTVVQMVLADTLFFFANIMPIMPLLYRSFWASLGTIQIIRDTQRGKG